MLESSHTMMAQTVFGKITSSLSGDLLLINSHFLLIYSSFTAHFLLYIYCLFSHSLLSYQCVFLDQMGSCPSIFITFISDIKNFAIVRMPLNNS